MPHPVTNPRNSTRFFFREQLGRYRRDEDGGFVIFTLFVLVMMVMIGGLAIDIMRYENLRTTMQNTIDRAVLAAADLDQKVDAQSVVDDYLSKAGMGNLPYEVTVKESKVGDTVVGRSVTVESTIDMRTYFMKMMGTPTLSVPAVTNATEAVNNIEVSLVLDVSGSMGTTKLENMKDAAQDFLDEIMANTEEGSVSVSLVPYSTQVNAGATLSSQFNMPTNHTYSYCVDFDYNDFLSTTLSTSTEIAQAGHFDPWTSYSYDSPRNFVCRNESYFEITPWSINAEELKDQIELFESGGNTSIDIAAKWGTALLDPSTAPALTGMVAAGEVDSGLDGRPSAYNNGDVLKFMVIMTDGINTTQYTLDPDYASGPSGIWRDPDTGRYSKEDEEWNDYDGDGDYNEEWWYAGGYGKNYGEYWIDEPYDRDTNGNNANGGPQANAYEMDWTEVWARMPINTAAYKMFYERYRNSNHYYNFRNATRDAVYDYQKDDRLDRVCSAAKDNNVVIFTIGFEVTDNSAAVMQSCASTANHFYRVDGLDINYAFESIANQINQLKLTQ